MISLRPITAKIQTGLIVMAAVAALAHLILSPAAITWRLAMLGVSVLAVGVGAFAVVWVLGMNYLNKHCPDHFLQFMCIIFSVPAGLLAVFFFVDMIVSPSRIHPQAFGFTALVVGCLLVWEKVHQGKRKGMFQPKVGQVSSETAPSAAPDEPST
jgi:hypothetical protein